MRKEFLPSLIFQKLAYECDFYKESTETFVFTLYVCFDLFLLSIHHDVMIDMSYRHTSGKRGWLTVSPSVGRFLCLKAMRRHLIVTATVGRPVARWFGNRREKGFYKSTAGRIDSSRIRPNSWVIVLSVDSGLVGIPVTGADRKAAKHDALACDGFAVNRKYIYDRPPSELREWCVQ